MIIMFLYRKYWHRYTIKEMIFIKENMRGCIVSDVKHLKRNLTWSKRQDNMKALLPRRRYVLIIPIGCLKLSKKKIGFLSYQTISDF